MKNLMKKIICSYFENNCTVGLTPVQIIDVVEEEMQGRYPYITFATCGWYFKFSEDKWGVSYSVSLIDKNLQEYARCRLTTDDDYQNGQTLKFEILDKPNCLKPESLEDIVYGIIPRIGQAVEFLSDKKWSINK